MKYRLNPTPRWITSSVFQTPPTCSKHPGQRDFSLPPPITTAEEAIYKDQIAFNEAVRQRVYQLVTDHRWESTLKQLTFNDASPLRA
jgi:hypothetical protein